MEACTLLVRMKWRSCCAKRGAGETAGAVVKCTCCSCRGPRPLSSTVISQLFMTSALGDPPSSGLHSHQARIHTPRLIHIKTNLFLEVKNNCGQGDGSVVTAFVQAEGPEFV